MVNICEICYAKVDQDQQVSYCNNCGNDYHRSCIRIAITQENLCPICKQSFIEQTLFDPEDSSATPEQESEPISPSSRLPTRQQSVSPTSPTGNYQLILLLGMLVIGLIGLIFKIVILVTVGFGGAMIMFGIKFVLNDMDRYQDILSNNSVEWQ